MIVDEIQLSEKHLCPKCQTPLAGQESVAGGTGRIRVFCPNAECRMLGPWTFDEKTALELFDFSMEERGVHHRS